MGKTHEKPICSASAKYNLCQVHQRVGWEVFTFHYGGGKLWGGFACNCCDTVSMSFQMLILAKKCVLFK